MIKVYTLSFLFFFSALLATAQFEKGQKLLGGTVAFNTSKSENYIGNYYINEQSSAVFSPTVAWFTKPNQLFGFGLQYGYQHSYNTSNNGNSNNSVWLDNHSIGLNVFSQRFVPLASKLYFTLNASASGTYNFGKSTYWLSGTKDVNNRGYSVNASIAPGLSYRLTPRFLFDAYLNNLVGVGYNHTSTDAPPNLPFSLRSYNNNFYISSSLSNGSLGGVGLGFRWLLKR